MLLATLTANLQSQYTQFQVQIEALQEQQRLIQAQLQRVGSVESKMESAAALLQEAIAEINDVCPGELVNYQETINSLFDGAVVGFLSEANTEPEPQQDPKPTFEAPTNETVTIETKVEKVTDILSANGNGKKANGHSPLTLEQIQLIDWGTLRRLASDRGITDPSSRRLTRKFVESAVIGKLILEDVKGLPEDILQSIQEVEQIN